jgi:hypothetical protein
VNERRTLDELDPPAWGPPSYDSYLVTRCYELRKKPLGDFSVEDLRIMIGQGIGLPHLIPMAISMLQLNPLAEGDFHSGDLLNAVLSVSEEHWRANRDQRETVDEIVDAFSLVTDELSESINAFHARPL